MATSNVIVKIEGLDALEALVKRLEEAATVIMAYDPANLSAALDSVRPVSGE